jgi:hypothetical protein
MSNFKIGDWVREPDGDIWKLDNEVEKGSYVDTDCELWQPKVGEWCWFRSDNMPKYIQVLAQFKEYYNGEYAVVFNPKDVEEGTETIYYTECEPFIGELPSFIKDNK